MSSNGNLEALAPEVCHKLEHIQDEFTVTADKLKGITNRFEEELREGLQAHDTNISMHITWVQGLPSGSETGQFLTLDLGGTNLRICWIKLNGRGKDTEVDQSSYKLPSDVKTSDAETLWNLVADSLGTFIEERQLHGDPHRPLPLGFCFSYPASQDRIDHGILKTWTKGFEIQGVEGEDVASQLREAIAKKKLPVKLITLVNDTTGAMVASAYNDPETICGAIFGTGCNAAYVENFGSIPKLKHDMPPETSMAINCEYGAFDNDRRVLPLTKYDKRVDEESPKPGEQAFEKMSAGLYLGEILRLVLLDFYDEKLLFQGQDASLLHESYRLDTAFLSALEDEPLEDSIQRFKDVLRLTISPEEAALVRRLAEIIAIRSARLCCCGIAAICHMKGVTKGHVAADGSVANKSPKFKGRWAKALGEVLGWPDDGTENPIVITSAEDGSGIGAAVITAMVMQ
ncbi:hexokinase-domain-containing protein [Xylariaceae sp. FL0016]|nr:hexokinase-domain-containing protein [Xylariaceae sp. FL0016]